MPAAKPIDTPAEAPLHWTEGARTPETPRNVRFVRIGMTVLAFAVAVFCALVIWNYYVSTPWTRDGSVRVQVANVAPQVTGQIVELRVVDNQFVHRGDVLYVIDPFDYQRRFTSAQASLKQSAGDYQAKKAEAERQMKLTTLSTSVEKQQAAAAEAVAAEGSFQSAQQDLKQAQVNLDRTRVTSPVNGFVTNLLMRVGDYATTGSTNVSVVDTDSFWVDGYFEETKLGRICVGDRAEAQLMGFDRPIVGQVEAVARGISVSNAAPSTQGLPSVSAVYTWVRLAQRVPVHVRITEVPPGVTLVSGLTATVTVRKPGETSGTLGDLGASVRGIFAHPATAPGCIPALQGATGLVARIPEPKAASSETPEQIAPGIAPGIARSPVAPGAAVP